MSRDPVRAEGPILCAVINWNGWRDTVVCLQSLFAVRHPSFQLVVCDNGSDNDSCERLAEWLRSREGAREGPRVDLDGGASVTRFDGSFGPASATVYLLGSTKNLGYAGALNRCMAWGRQALGARHFWLLNNDVRCDPQALSELAAVAASDPAIGLVGSVLMDWDRPQSVQAVAGAYRRWLAVGAHTRRLPAHAAAQPLMQADVDYPVGASMFVTDRFLQAVGPMDERYFLYYEEMDWAERGRRLGFRPAVALNSRIEHREGASTGSHGGVRNKSLLSEHYGVVNRLRITRKFWPHLLPLVWASLWLVVADRLVHREFRRAALVLRLMFTLRNLSRRGPRPPQAGRPPAVSDS
jgi:GT2 family glycosyltransferase